MSYYFYLRDRGNHKIRELRKPYENPTKPYEKGYRLQGLPISVQILSKYGTHILIGIGSSLNGIQVLSRRILPPGAPNPYENPTKTLRTEWGANFGFDGCALGGWTTNLIRSDFSMRSGRIDPPPNTSENPTKTIRKPYETLRKGDRMQ